MTPFAGRHPTAFAKWLTAIDLSLASIAEVAIVGGLDEPGTRDLTTAATAGPTGALVVAVSSDPDASAVPLLSGRVRIRDRPTAYVCRNFACRLPVTDPDALSVQLREERATL